MEYLFAHFPPDIISAVFFPLSGWLFEHELLETVFLGITLYFSLPEMLLLLL